MKDVLQEGEKLLYQNERVDFAIYKSRPILHAAGSVPGLHVIALMVTDRRVVIQGAILGGVPIAEFDLWYPRRAASGECDVLEEVAVGKDPLGGEYLHLAARACKHGPLRSDVAEMYLYTNETERLARMLNACMEAEQLEWR